MGDRTQADDWRWPAPAHPGQAFVTLVTSAPYVAGALVLGFSLRRAQTTRVLVVLVTAEVPVSERRRLGDIWDRVVLVDELQSGDDERLALLTRPELGVTFTKIQAWRLTDYHKAVFLDADTLAMRCVDELFARSELSAAPDTGWPDCFNSGVFVFVPSQATFEALMERARTEGSFDGGDQGLLNAHWRDWATADIQRHLPFVYNMHANAAYSYRPAYQRFKDDVRIVHFLGPHKPWHWPRTTDKRVYAAHDSPVYSLEHVERWWRIYDQYADWINHRYQEQVGSDELPPVPIMASAPATPPRSSTTRKSSVGARIAKSRRAVRARSLSITAEGSDPDSLHERLAAMAVDSDARDLDD